MDITSFFNFFQIAAKGGLLVGLVVYLVFALLIIRQVELMIRSFETPGEVWLKRLSWAHLGVVLLMMVVVLVVL